MAQPVTRPTVHTHHILDVMSSIPSVRVAALVHAEHLAVDGDALLEGLDGLATDLPAFLVAPRGAEELGPRSQDASADSVEPGLEVAGPGRLGEPAPDGLLGAVVVAVGELELRCASRSAAARSYRWP